MKLPVFIYCFLSYTTSTRIYIILLINTQMSNYKQKISPNQINIKKQQSESLPIYLQTNPNTTNTNPNPLIISNNTTNICANDNIKMKTNVNTNMNMNISTGVQNYEICFNPDCSLPNSRIFQPTNAHRNLYKCKKWIVKVKDLGQLQYIENDHDNNIIDQKQDKNINNNNMNMNMKMQNINMNNNNQSNSIQQKIQFTPKNKQIKQLLNIWSKINNINWQQYLSSYKTKLLKQYQNYLSKTFRQIYNKILQLKTKQTLQMLQQLYINIQSQQRYKLRQLTYLIQDVIQYSILPFVNKNICINIGVDISNNTNTDNINMMMKYQQNKMSQQFKQLQQYMKNIQNKIITIKQIQQNNDNYTAKSNNINITNNNNNNVNDTDNNKYNPLNNTTYTTSNIVLSKNNNNNNYKTISQQSHEQFRRFFIQDTANYNKLQQISAICGKKCDQFNQRSRDISLKCPFCMHQIRRKLLAAQAQLQGKMIKKQIASDMLRHCYNNHYNFIYQKYQSKKSYKKIPTISTSPISGCYQITFQQLLINLLSNKYKKLHIFDRQSGITNTQVSSKIRNNQITKIQNQTYYIQILSKSNKAMAKMRHLLTPDRKTTQFIINYLLVYVCLLEGIMEIDDITIDSNSKDLNRLSNIRQVIAKKQNNQLTYNNNNYNSNYQNTNLKKQIKRQDYGKLTKNIKRQHNDQSSNYLDINNFDQSLIIENFRQLRYIPGSFQYPNRQEQQNQMINDNDFQDGRRRYSQNNQSSQYDKYNKNKNQDINERLKNTQKVIKSGQKNDKNNQKSNQIIYETWKKNEYSQGSNLSYNLDDYQNYDDSDESLSLSKSKN